MPDDVAADASRLVRFQNEVAYLDRMQPSDDEVRDDAELLGSKAGVRVIAWLWPNASTTRASTRSTTCQRRTRGSGTTLSRTHTWPARLRPSGRRARAVDRRREHRRQVAARRFERIIELTARKLGHDDVEALKTHLKWSALLTQLELDRLLRAQTPFPFRVIFGLCGALQLEFRGGWDLVDPQRLARRIEHSVRASAIAAQLDRLTLDNLENVARRLPRATDAGQSQGRDSYRAPAPGARYSSLSRGTRCRWARQP